MLAVGSEQRSVGFLVLGVPDPMPAQRRSPTKIDVELRRLDRRYDLFEIGLRGLAVAGCMVALYIPLSLLQGIVEPLAGKQTKVDVNVAMAVTATGSLALNGIQFSKGALRKREIKRLRQRTDELESGLGVTRDTQRRIIQRDEVQR